MSSLNVQINAKIYRRFNIRPLRLLKEQTCPVYFQSGKYLIQHLSDDFYLFDKFYSLLVSPVPSIYVYT